MEAFVVSPQEQIVSLLIKNQGRTVRESKLPNMTGLDQKTISQVLKKLKHCNLIEVDRHSRVNSKIPSNAVMGIISMTPSGSGFIKSTQGQDFYVPKGFVRNSIHKDKVLAVPTFKPDKEKTCEAMVLCVLEHGITDIVGTFVPSDNKKYGFVIPDDSNTNFDLYVGFKYSKGARPYDKVVASIVKFPEREGKRPVGEVKEILGMSGDVKAEQESVIRAFGLPEKFSAEVIKEAQAFNKDKPENWDLSHRTDFRDEHIVTIDCDTSKDLDDAISIKKTDTGYQLGVYIADVAHYVRENTAIDREAFNRGNSTYLLNQVVPMLPPILSNNLCSLNPGIDRLVLAVVMDIDKNGTVVNHTLSEGVIRSSGRLNYSEVSQALNGVKVAEFVSKHGTDTLEMLKIAEELQGALKNKRESRGAIDFDIPETQIIMDETGVCIDIKPNERGIANEIIEEFMLLTNETVAQEFFEKKIPFIYRIHSAPIDSKLDVFKTTAKVYGIDCSLIDKENITSKDLQDFLKSLKGDLLETPIKTLLLQSMKQARYSEILTPHFSLAAPYYCHFTSPIRRYPDLMIHRIIKMYLRGAFINDAIKGRYVKLCEEAAKQSSKTERVSDQAELEVIKNKSFEYIMNHKENVYEGFIRSMNKVGVYVSLDNSLDGFIKNKSYKLDTETLTCEIQGRTLSIGDRIRVKASSINQNTKEIQYTLI